MPDARYQAVINAGCLLLMPAIAADYYRDAMSSLLYGQLAASKKHSAFAAWDQWHEVFIGALKQFGWAALRTEYRAIAADTHFCLLDLMALDDLSLTESQCQASQALCRYLAAAPGTDKALQVFQRHTAARLGTDAVDVSPDALKQSAAGAESAPISAQRAAPSNAHNAVAAHFGVMLPGRHIKLLSVHFETQEGLSENIFGQRFSGSKVAGGIVLKTFVGELCEVRYAFFRQRFASVLREHWSRDVVEQLPFARANA